MTSPKELSFKAFGFSNLYTEFLAWVGLLKAETSKQFGEYYPIAYYVSRLSSEVYNACDGYYRRTGQHPFERVNFTDLIFSLEKTNHTARYLADCFNLLPDMNRKYQFANARFGNPPERAYMIFLDNYPDQDQAELLRRYHQLHRRYESLYRSADTVRGALWNILVDYSCRQTLPNSKRESLSFAQMTAITRLTDHPQ